MFSSSLLLDQVENVIELKLYFNFTSKFKMDIFFSLDANG